jgi:hypothetical protein
VNAYLMMLKSDTNPGFKHLPVILYNYRFITFTVTYISFNICTCIIMITLFCKVIQLNQIIKSDLSPFPSHLSHLRFFGHKTFSWALGAMSAVSS